MKQSPCEIITHTLGALFTCSKVKNYIRIRTPFLYPDGDVIDLFYLEQDGVSTVTDFGETLRWLKMQSLSIKRSPRQLKLIEDICMNHGIEFYKGMLSARIKEGDDLAKAVMRVSQGALRTADLWFTLRTRAIESTAEEIELFFDEKEIPFERNQSAAGRSGKIWRVDFHTRMPRRSSLVYVLSSGSRAASRGVVEHVVTAWYDLSNLKFGPEGLQFVSLFDDTMDIWIPEDFKLLQDLSTVARWTKPDDFFEILAA
jgi:hypothetical protein